MSEKSNLPVPLGIDKLEALKFNADRKMDAVTRKQLADVLRKKLMENEDALHQVINQVREDILSAERERAGIKEYTEQIEDLKAQITAIHDKIEAVELRCQNATGFQTDGDLLDEAAAPYKYGSDDSKRALWKGKRAAGYKKAAAIRERMGTAVKRYERFATKWDKVMTRLLLADTCGEAMTIMDAVLGNGDDILSPPTTTDTKE